MATARIAKVARTFLAHSKTPNHYSSCYSSGAVCRRPLLCVYGGGIQSSFISSTTATWLSYPLHLPLAARWSEFRVAVTASSKSSHQQLASFSSLPKRYQKRDDETQEEYELRVKELRLQDAQKKYQTLLETEEKSEPLTAIDRQEKLCDAMEQLRQAYEDLLFWDKAIEIEEKLLQRHQTSMAASQGKSSANSSEQEEQMQRKVANSLVKLGDLYGETGNHFVEARRHYKQALDIYNQIHLAHQYQKEKQQQQPASNNESSSSSSTLSHQKPPMHADMGGVIHSVAMTFARQEEFDKAAALLRQAKEHFEYHGLPLPIGEQDEVPEGHKAHPGILQVLDDHALIFRMMERYEMAGSVYQEARSYATELQLEPTSEYWIDLDMNTADCQMALGHTDQALYTYQSLLEKAVSRRLKASDDNDGDDEGAMSLESVMRHNIGHIHAKMGRYQDALDEFTKAYSLKKQVSNNDTHPELINTLHGMGAVSAALGNHTEARGHFREALTIARLHADPTLGDDDPKVSYALRNLEKVQKDRPPSQAF